MQRGGRPTILPRIKKKKMKWKSLSALLFGVALVLSACGSDSGGSTDITGPGGAEEIINDPSTPISYSQQVAPIFQGSCAGSGCHVNNSRNGVELTTYSTTMASVGTNYGSKIVIAGNASLSPLVDKIEANPAIGDRMPDGRAALSQAKIDLIRKWINEGALNN
jgi:mono/diheme cytochrome c family protein